MRLLISLLLPVFLLACTSGTGYRYPTGPTALPVLSSVTLNATFDIRPDRASEYIQYGQVRPYNRIVEYYPHCIFELRTVSEAARSVAPGTFAVTAIRRDRFMAGYRKIMVAGNGGDYNPVMSITQISLHSDTQPDVFRLTCRQLDEPYLARHVSLEQMRETLGELFTLQ
jgi:hypothetical protein